MSKKNVIPSEAPKNEAEAKAIMANAAVVPMNGTPKATPKPNVTVDEKKLSEQVRGKVTLRVKEGTAPVKPTNAGGNPSISSGGEVLHTNQVKLVINPFGGKK